MSRIYSLPTFFRMVPNSMLKGFFDQRGVDTSEVPWKYLKQREVKQLLQMFRELPHDTQLEFEGIFQDVFDLACETGFESLQHAAEIFNEHLWLKSFEKKPSLYAISFWAWYAYRPMFQFALARHHAKHLLWWRKRKMLPILKPDWNDDTRHALESALQNYFVEKQNRGDVCTVEMQTFDERTYYFFAWPDDYIRHFQQHDEEGNLKPKRARPTFGIVFAYDSEEGTLAIHAKGSEKMKSELEEIFLASVICQSCEQSENVPYDLSVLAWSNFTLASDPEDCVLIQLKELRLKWRQCGSVHFRPDRNVKWTTMLEKTALSEELSRADAMVEYAKFQFLFFSNLDEKGGSLTFEITPPNRCTLQNRDPKRVELIRKYLRKWRIENDIIIEKNPEIVPAG